MSEQPWYKDGLRFKCTQCGDCCTGAPGFVWVNKQEMQALADRLGLSLDDFQKRYARKVGIRYSLKEFPNGDCVFFDSKTRKCGVYEDRPRQCRTWPFWDSNIRTEEDWRQTCEECPGSGQGPLVPLQQIEEQRNVMRI